MIDTSIIISTYNSPEWLAKVLYGYNNQTYRNFEIVIADDGSKQDTIDLIEKLKKDMFYPVIHVWHEDNGFQKSQILNKAIVACTTPYIIMSDGDCIPRMDFVEVHVKNREVGYFLSGGYFMLPISISEKITKDDIYSERCFNVSWLKTQGLRTSFKNNKLSARGFKSWFLNSITPTNASWNGHNASGWKKDIVAINGFDERMQYGGQDRELGERLMNYGLKSKQIRYSAVCVHLDHKRGYKNQESIDKNRQIRNTTKSENKSWTDYGILKKIGFVPKATVIISTYNQPEWLEKCLWGYENQDEEDFDIIIADDGSNKDTESFINEFKLKSELRITHIWQEDSGFRKNIILNRAIQSSKADYLIFTDGDCIPRADFVNTHLRCRRQNSFLSGGYFKLPKSISDLINRKDIDTQKCFDVNWLLNKGLKKSFKINKLTSSGFKETILNMLTPTKATWDGMNVSAYKSDIINVNGYDERLSYGGEDRELGERLMNFGVKAIQIRYSAICLHLYHERGYVDKESWNSNNQIRKQVKKQKLIWSDFGIKRNR